MWRWTEESLGWYVAAGRDGDYFPRLARAVEPWLLAGGHVGDLGCGPGFLSLELARLGHAVTAIDVDARVVAFLEEEVRRLGVAGVRAVAGDALSLGPGVLFDDVLLCLFGCTAGQVHDPATSGEGLLSAFLSHARHRVVAVVNTAPTRASGRGGRAVAGDMERALGAEGLPFERRDIVLEFGQPFAGADEARAFLAHYRAGEDRAYVDRCMAALVRRADGSLYLPHAKPLSLFAYPVGGDRAGDGRDGGI